MSPDVLPEDLYPLLDLRARLKRRPDPSAIYRWANRGLKGVRLRTAKVGGVLHTCDLWVMEFFNRDQADAAPAPPAEASPLRTPSQDRRALSRAKQLLASRGLLVAAGP